MVLPNGDFSGRPAILVSRALSEATETTTKGRQGRIVPLASPAVAALRRLRAREDFTAPNDHIFVNRFGRRLHPGTIANRYRATVKAAGMRHVRFHGLRATAGTLVGREREASFVRDVLGHAELGTTSRYVSTKFDDDDHAALNRAFQAEPKTEDQALAERIAADPAFADRLPELLTKAA